MQVNIKNLIDDGQCYQTVRELRWPDGVKCSSCQSTQVIKRGFDDTEPARQRYECTACHTRFDDLTDTIFAGHHQSLKVWILCLYFMGLNLSNEQIAHELDVDRSDVQQMTTQLRQGINWLQVFKRAHTALLCSGRGPEHRTSLVPSEKCVVGWGSDDDDMRMITARFVRAIERFTGDLCLHFLPLFQ